MARTDKHRWLYKIGQPVNTPLGKAKIYAITPKVVSVKFTNPPADGHMFYKFYLEPRFEHQLRIDQITAIS